MATEPDPDIISRYESDLSKVTTRCRSRCISAQKWVSFVMQTKRKHFGDSSSLYQLDAALARVLLSHILASSPPPVLLLQYLRAAVLGSTAEASRQTLSNVDVLLTSNDVLLGLLSACAGPTQAARHEDASLSLGSSLQAASVEAVCTEIAATGSLVLLDSEDNLNCLYRAIKPSSESMMPCQASAALILVRAAASLFQMSFSQQDLPLIRTMSLQVMSGPAYGALSRESKAVNEQQSSIALALVERCLALCHTRDLQSDAVPFDAVKVLLTSLGAGSFKASTIPITSKAKRNRFHPDLKLPLLNQWDFDPDRLSSLLGQRSSIHDLVEWQPRYGPEIPLLLQSFVSKESSFATKMDAAGALLQAWTSGENGPLIRPLFYLSLLLEATRLVAIADAEQYGQNGLPFPTPAGGRSSKSGSEGALWLAVLCGLVPQVLAQLESGQTPRRSASETASTSVQKAITALFALGGETLSVCETKHAPAEEKPEAQTDGDVTMNDLVSDAGSQLRRPIRASLLRSVLDTGLVDQDLVNRISQDNEVLAQDLASLTPSYQSEIVSDTQLSSSATTPLQALLSERLSGGDFPELLERVASDYGAQKDFAFQLTVTLANWTSTSEPQLETVSQICKALGENTVVLDSVMLYVTAERLLSPLASLFDREDLGQLSDEPLIHGNILLFIQLCLRRYDLEGDLDLHLGGSHFLPQLFRSTSEVHLLSSLSAEDHNLIGRWITALFDSEGISDELIRSSSPQTLLRLAPTLAFQCVKSCASGIMDLDTLKSGLTYFCNPILSWTLPGVLSRLTQDLESPPAFSVSARPSFADVPSSQTNLGAADFSQTTLVAPPDTARQKVLLETLCMLLVNEGCPPLALQSAFPQGAQTVIHKATSSSNELSESANSDLAALKLKSESFAVTKLQPSMSVQRLLARQLPTSLLETLSSPHLTLLNVQSISSGLVSPDILGLHPRQLSECQKSIVTRLLMSASSSLLRGFVQSIPLESVSETHQIQPARASYQVVSQCLVLLFELAEIYQHHDMLMLGEILALRLARVQAKTNALPLVAQALLSIQSPASLIQPLKIVFFDSLNP